VLPDTEWLIDPAVAYLNHGGFGALPRPVADAADALRREIEANPTDLFMRRWQGLVDEVRGRVAAFLHGDPAGCVFVANATAGTATVFASLGLGDGDEIVTTDHRYPAVAAQAGALAARGVRLVEVALPLSVPTPEAVVATILGAVTARTRLVVVDDIASPTGFRFPVEAIVAACREAGVPVLVDAAHAPGQVPVDVDAIGADFWVGNLHKWVCSPVASHGFSGGLHEAFDWTGTFDPIPLLSIPAALDFWAALGWEAVRAHQHALATIGADHVAESIGTHVPIAEQFTAAMRLIALPRPLARDEGETLMQRLTLDHKVTAYVTHHQGSSYIRVCGQLYNTPGHYERLAAALPGLL
jgi:isopenicillin-N epimerase